MNASGGGTTVPTPLLVWNYSSDSDEPSYLPKYPSRTLQPPPFDPANRNDPAHPLHPQHEQYLRRLELQAHGSENGGTLGAHRGGVRPKVDERQKVKQEMLNNPELLRKAVILSQKKEELHRQRQADRQHRKKMMRAYLEGVYAPKSFLQGNRNGMRRNTGQGRSSRGRNRSQDDWGNYYDEEEEGGFLMDIMSYPFDRRKAATCMNVLAIAVCLAGILVTATFFYLSETAYSFPKLYYTSAVVGALTIIAAFVGALGTWMNHVDILWGFAALVGSLSLVDLIIAIMGLTEKESEIIAALQARQQQLPTPALIDICVNNARVMSLTVMVAFLILAFCCATLYRFRKVLLTDANLLHHDDGVELSAMQPAPVDSQRKQHQDQTAHSRYGDQLQSQLHSSQLLNQQQNLTSGASIQSNNLQQFHAVQEQQEIRITMPAEKIITF